MLFTAYNDIILKCVWVYCFGISHNYPINEELSLNYQDYIEIVPGKRSGKPCIKGTRITVYDVLGWLANGMTQQEIAEDFPEINQQQIQSCLAYASEREHHLRTVNAA